MMAYLINLILFTILASSCALTSKKTAIDDVGEDYRYHQNKDFSDHLAQLGDDFISSNQLKKILLSKESNDFIQGVIEQITNNNELIFKKAKKFDVFIIEDSRPIVLSFPSRKIIISSSLISRYIKYEDLLASLIATELIRIENKVYSKNLIVPIGFVPIEDLAEYLAIPLDYKYEVNKWAYYSLRRSGYDPLSVLRLLQVKNKNFLDFLGARESADYLSREESNFKSFLAQNNLIDSDTDKIERNSSRKFYKFISEVSKHEQKRLRKNSN